MRFMSPWDPHVLMLRGQKYKSRATLSRAFFDSFIKTANNLSQGLDCHLKEEILKNNEEISNAFFLL